MADLSFDDVPMAKKPSAARSPDISFDDVPLTKRPTPKPAPKPTSYFGDVARNFGPDVQRQVTGIKAALSNPAATVGALRDVALGGLENSRYAMGPGNSGFMKPIASPAQRKAAYDVYEGMRQHIVHPATSFRKEPVSTLMDWSAPLTMGGTALETAPLRAANVAGRALTVAGEVTDPIGAAMKASGATLRAAKRVVPTKGPSVPGSNLRAVSEAAMRQNIPVPTTLASPSARLAADVLPPGLAINAVKSAEQAVEPAVGQRVTGIAAEHGTAAEPAELGRNIQEDAARWSQDMNNKGGKLFREAHALSQSTPIALSNTSEFLKKRLGELGQTPETNAPQINILKKVQSDLLNPKSPPSLQNVRDVRTGLYGTLSSSDIGLTPTQKGALVESLWGNMSKDMEQSLTDAAANGNPNAAKALGKLKQANAVWAERAQTNKRVLAQVLGKSENDILETGPETWGADMRPEAALAAVQRFSSKDRRSLFKLMDTVSPDTAGAVKASIISSLGKSADGDFSPQRFLNNLTAIPDSTKLALFGKDTVSALDDLRTVSEGLVYRKGNQGTWGAKLLKGLLTAGQVGAAASHAGSMGATLAGELAFNTVAAHTLASPTAARWLTKIAKASEQGQEAVGKVLNQMGTAATKDPVVASLRKATQQIALNPDAYIGGEDKSKIPKVGFDASKMSDEEIAALTGQASTAEPESLDSVVSAIEGVEGGPNAGANIGGTSSATGPGQFVRDTFVATYKAAFPEEAANMTDDEIAAIQGTEEGNRIQHETLLPLYTQQNRDRLLAEGFKATAPEVYLAHFLGVTGAMGLLNADPAASVEDVVSPAAVTANKSVLKGKTVREVLQWAEDKMAEHGASPDAP